MFCITAFLPLFQELAARLLFLSLVTPNCAGDDLLRVESLQAWDSSWGPDSTHCLKLGAGDREGTGKSLAGSSGRWG